MRSCFSVFLSPRELREVLSDGDTLCFGHGTQRTHAGSDLKASSLTTGLHCTERCYAKCRGRRATNGSTKLSLLWTRAMTSMARYAWGREGRGTHSWLDDVAEWEIRLIGTSSDSEDLPCHILLPQIKIDFWISNHNFYLTYRDKHMCLIMESSKFWHIHI